MIKLHLFSGFENKKLGITPETALGHLYSDMEQVAELKYAGARVGMKDKWLQNKDDTGIWHFDLWGKPLEKAKRLFPIVTDFEFVADVLRLKRSR